MTTGAANVVDKHYRRRRLLVMSGWGSLQYAETTPTALLVSWLDCDVRFLSPPPVLLLLLMMMMMTVLRLQTLFCSVTLRRCRQGAITFTIRIVTLLLLLLDVNNCVCWCYCGGGYCVQFGQVAVDECCFVTVTGSRQSTCTRVVISCLLKLTLNGR